MAGVDGADAASALADTQFRLRRQDQLRIDQQIALVHVAVGIGPELDQPFGAGIVDLRLVISCEPPEPPLDWRAPVEMFKFIGQGPDGLSLEDWKDALDPCVLGWV